MSSTAEFAEKTLALCADDFGCSVGVSQGIAQLVAQGRLSAVSCLSSGAEWASQCPTLAQAVAASPQRVQVGLHFNLTEGTPLSASMRQRTAHHLSLGHLIARSHAHQLDVTALQDEWQAQWDTFTQVWGRRPDFVDGHQHVHHLPQVRDVLLGFLQDLQAPQLAVRSTGALPGQGFGFKRWVISHTGGRQLAQALRQQQRPHNASLWGVYDFRAPQYRWLMQRWLQQIPPVGALLFCHPGVHPDPSDPIGPARQREWAYLGSDEFTQDLQAARTRLGSAW